MLYDAFHNAIELTTEQQACLRYTGDRTLMVKGYAGSGKSIVLMTIADAMLKKYGRFASNRVAIFTYQNTLVSTTKELLQVNGNTDEGILVSTVNSYTKAIYDELVRLGKAPRRKYPNPNAKDKGKAARLKNVETALNKHKAKYGEHRFHSLPLEFWLDEFDWMKDMNICKDDMDAYVLYKRKGRGNKYRFSGSDYVTAFQIYTFYVAYLEASGQGDWADQPMFLIRNHHLIPEKYKFENVLIDEAQDLSLAQMTALLYLYRQNGQMIVAMDANQKIHGKYWTPKLLGIDTTTKKLTKSMRTTVEIDSLAESVRSKNDGVLDDDDKNLRAIPERHGAIPKLVHLDSRAAEKKYVISLVKAYRKGNSNATIGIIGAKSYHITEYSKWLTDADIPHEQIVKDSTFSMRNPGVKVASAYSAKGLEFDIVIIPMFEEGNFPYSYMPDDEELAKEYMIRMRNLVYVSMTRARHLLVITWCDDNGSRFIADMNPSLYEFEGSKYEIRTPRFYFGGTASTSTSVSSTGNQTKVETPAKTSGSKNESLTDYLKRKGVKVVDKRDKGGGLWIVGGKEMSGVINETRKLYGAGWTFCQNGSRSTGFKESWFTRSQK